MTCFPQWNGMPCNHIFYYCYAVFSLSLLLWATFLEIKISFSYTDNLLLFGLWAPFGTFDVTVIATKSSFWRWFGSLLSLGVKPWFFIFIFKLRRLETKSQWPNFARGDFCYSFTASNLFVFHNWIAKLSRDTWRWLKTPLEKQFKSLTHTVCLSSLPLNQWFLTWVLSNPTSWVNRSQGFDDASAMLRHTRLNTSIR